MRHDGVEQLDLGLSGGNMGITYGDHLIDSGANDITPEQEREIEAREECSRRGLNPDDDAADGVLVWMVVDRELREREPIKEVREFKNLTGKDRTMIMRPGAFPDYR